MLPVSYFLALGGMLFSYCVDTWLALRACQKPRALSRNVVSAITVIIQWLPMIQVRLCSVACLATAL